MIEDTHHEIERGDSPPRKRHCSTSLDSNTTCISTPTVKPMQHDSSRKRVLRSELEDLSSSLRLNSNLSTMESEHQDDHTISISDALILSWSFQASDIIKEELRVFVQPYQIPHLTLLRIYNPLIDLMEPFGVYVSENQTFSCPADDALLLLDEISREYLKNSSALVGDRMIDCQTPSSSSLLGNWNNPRFAQWIIEKPANELRKLQSKLSIQTTKTASTDAYIDDYKFTLEVLDSRNVFILGVISMVKDLWKEMWERVRRTILGEEDFSSLLQDAHRSSGPSSPSSSTTASNGKDVKIAATESSMFLRAAQLLNEVERLLRFAKLPENFHQEVIETLEGLREVQEKSQKILSVPQEDTLDQTFMQGWSNHNTKEIPPLSDYCGNEKNENDRRTSQIEGNCESRSLTGSIRRKQFASQKGIPRSGITGVTWHRHYNSWQSYRIINGEKKWKMFSAKKFGFEESKEKAIEWNQGSECTTNGVSKVRLSNSLLHDSNPEVYDNDSDWESASASSVSDSSIGGKKSSRGGTNRNLKNSRHGKHRKVGVNIPVQNQMETGHANDSVPQSGVPGVTFSRCNSTWDARRPGSRLTFSTKQYGYDGARDIALFTRQLYLKTKRVHSRSEVLALYETEKETSSLEISNVESVVGCVNTDTEGILQQINAVTSPTTLVRKQTVEGCTRRVEDPGDEIGCTSTDPVMDEIAIISGHQGDYDRSNSSACRVKAASYQKDTIDSESDKSNNGIEAPSHQHSKDIEELQTQNENRNRNRRSSSGVTGVTWDGSSNSWVGSWKNGHGSRQQYFFAVGKFGDQCAKELAILTRREAERLQQMPSRDSVIQQYWSIHGPSQAIDDDCTLDSCAITEQQYHGKGLGHSPSEMHSSSTADLLSAAVESLQFVPTPSKEEVNHSFNIATKKDIDEMTTLATISTIYSDCTPNINTEVSDVMDEGPTFLIGKNGSTPNQIASKRFAYYGRSPEPIQISQNLENGQLQQIKPTEKNVGDMVRAPPSAFRNPSGSIGYGGTDFLNQNTSSYTNLNYCGVLNRTQAPPSLNCMPIFQSMVTSTPPLTDDIASSELCPLAKDVIQHQMDNEAVLNQFPSVPITYETPMSQIEGVSLNVHSDIVEKQDVSMDMNSHLYSLISNYDIRCSHREGQCIEESNT